MALDELALACRMTGHSLDDLWVRYLETGGNRSKSDLVARLAGAPWPETEDRILQVAVDDVLRDLGLPLLTGHPAFEPRAETSYLVGLRPVDDDWTQRAGEDPSTVPAPAFGTRFTELLARSARARASARDTRAWARSVRLDTGTSGHRGPGEA